MISSVLNIDYTADDLAARLVSVGKRVAVEDTREQLPLRLDLPTVRRRLDTGDYSLLGYEGQISVERKGPADLVQSVGRDSARFAKCIDRLAEFSYPLIICEGSWSDVINATKRGNFSAAYVEREIIAIMRRGIPVIFPGTRELASVAMQKFLERSARWVDRQVEIEREGEGQRLG